MKKKKLNKAQRQAGHRLCNNIKNTRNQNRPNVGFKKTAPVVIGHISQEYITHASGEYSLDQYIDISKLVELKERMTKDTSIEEPLVTAKPQVNNSRGRGISGAFGRLIKFFREKSA